MRFSAHFQKNTVAAKTNLNIPVSPKIHVQKMFLEPKNTTTQLPKKNVEYSANYFPPNMQISPAILENAIFINLLFAFDKTEMTVALASLNQL